MSPSAVTPRKPAPSGLGLLRVCVICLAVMLGWNFWLQRELRVVREQAERERHFWVLGQRNSPVAERTEAFLALLRLGNREWRGAHLQGLPLPELALTNAPLAEADLRGSDLRRADLRGASLTGALLGRADLTEAQLAGADCAGANLLQARLPDADLSRASFRSATLEQVAAARARFVTADLADAVLLMADLSGANLSGADLSGANLEAAILRGASLDLARLSEAHLKDTDFTNANWWRARGLNRASLDYLVQRFAPTDEAPADLRADFAKWRKDFATQE